MSEFVEVNRWVNSLLIHWFGVRSPGGPPIKTPQKTSVFLGFLWFLRRLPPFPSDLFPTCFGPVSGVRIAKKLQSIRPL